MNKSKSSLLRIMIISLFLNGFLSGVAGAADPLGYGGYRNLLASKKGESFALVIWSLDCSSCLKEMETLKEIHQENPELKIVLISVDEFSKAKQVDAMLEKKGLAKMESWLFSESNAQRLRYEIDPSWYGELPRSYFFDEAHQRKAVSGKLSKQEFLSLIH